MVEDSTFQDADIFVYEYPSPKIGHSYNINELAEDLRLTISDNVVSDHKRIIFLAHSMGGLIVRQYLLKYRDVVEKVPFIYFFATPTTGSPMATLVSEFSKNPQFGNLRPMKVDEYLKNLQLDWLADPTLRTIPSFCAYETENLLTVKIVEQESATNLCNRQIDPNNANHIEIVKPGTPEAKPYRAFKSAYINSLGVGTQSSSIGLRAEIENAKQAIDILGTPPKTMDGDPVFCDSMKLSLVLAHTGKSKVPILINSIAINSSSLTSNQLQSGTVCKIDKLSSVPHGIIEKNIFAIKLEDKNILSHYIKDASNAIEVDSNNILASKLAARAISLKEAEEPVGLDIMIHSFAEEPRELTFKINYDQNGEKSITTKPVIIWK
jgi:hypothetical protein